MCKNGNGNGNGHKLTPKQRLFVAAYLTHWNGVKAAEEAGYKGDYNTLGVTAHDNLKKPKIRAEIEKQLSAMAMGPEEVLWRLGQQARADYSEYVDKGGVINFDKVKESGHVVKSITWTKSGVKLELYDAQAALVHLGKAHALFTDRKEVEVKGEIPISLIEIEKDDD